MYAYIHTYTYICIRQTQHLVLAFWLRLRRRPLLKETLDGRYPEHTLVLGIGAWLDSINQFRHDRNATDLVLHPRWPRSVPREDEDMLMVEVDCARACLADGTRLLARGGSLNTNSRKSVL
jgi:hypothetical protein